MKPRYEVQTRKLDGSPHVVHSIVLRDGRVAHSQISPYSDAEIAERVANFMSPPPEPPVQSQRVSLGQGRPGRKPKGETYDWRDGNTE